jgi:PAS domain S-box-containing protein
MKKGDKQVNGLSAGVPEEYQRLFDLVPDPLWIDQGHSLVLVNSACVALLRAIDTSQILGKSPFDFIHPDYHEMIRRRIPQALANPGRMPVIQERLVRFDGTQVHVEVNASRFDLNGKPAIVAIFRDITERKLAQESVLATEAQLRLIMEASPVIIAYAGRDQVVEYSNRALIEFLGTEHDTSAGRHIANLLGQANYETVRADIEHALSGSPVLAERIWRRPDGEVREVQASFTPDHAPDGTARGLVLVATDITNLKQIQKRQRFMVELLERTRILADVNDALRLTVEMLATHLGVSRCFYAEIDLTADTIVVMADHSPTLTNIVGTYRLSTFELVGLTDLIAGRIVTVPAGHERDCRATLAVPTMRGERRTVLALQSETPRVWSEYDIEILNAAAERTWLTAESVRVRQREHHIAATLQRSLLQMPAVDSFEGLALHTEYKPALAEADVGGDFLDAFAIAPGRVALVVGDVSGKGVTAAARTAETRYVLRGYLRELGDPAQVMARVNTVISTNYELEPVDTNQGFVCVSLVVIDTQTGVVTASLAGCEPPLIITASGRVTPLEATGMPLGVDANAIYGTAVAHVESGDTILMVTDGITEARRGGQMYGQSGLIASAARHAPKADIDIAAQRILDDARRFAGIFRDDIALLLARRL